MSIFHLLESILGENVTFTLTTCLYLILTPASTLYTCQRDGKIDDLILRQSDQSAARACSAKRTKNPGIFVSFQQPTTLLTKFSLLKNNFMMGNRRIFSLTSAKGTQFLFSFPPPIKLCELPLYTFWLEPHSFVEHYASLMIFCMQNLLEQNVY